MSEALKLGGEPLTGRGHSIRRLNRVPIFVVIGLIVLFFGAVIYGLSTRGLNLGGRDEIDALPSALPASTFADQLKKGVSDAIIGEPFSSPFQPAPDERGSDDPPAPALGPEQIVAPPRTDELEPEEIWRARIKREQQEQVLRELHRQSMASLQADEAAFNSPIAVSLENLDASPTTGAPTDPGTGNARKRQPRTGDLYAAALQSGLTGQSSDPNGQAAKETFFNQDIEGFGYLPNQVVPQQSPYELKRGSVIPATLMTGINSDLPGRIAAQVSQNVYDSATGRNVLIPQGSKLLGRYDSKIAFGQSRVLVIWTDIMFPDGSTLQIGGMPGVDSAGFSGLSDRVDRHYLRTFGSAVLTALIGAGTEMMIPQDRNAFGRSNGAEDAARRSFAETFGKMAHQTVSKNLNVQPTLSIRPGYRFNVLVERDVTFPAPWPQ